MTRISMPSRLRRAAVVAIVLMVGIAPARAGGPTLSPEQDPLVRNMDASVSPGSDFFKYACGRWLKENPIPASERGWGIANLVNEETYRQRLGICQDAAKSKAAKGTNEQKIGDYWAAGMDSVTVDKQGIEPLKPWLAQISNVHTRTEMLGLIAKLQTIGVNAGYGMFVAQDEKNSSQYIVHLYQAGLHMPDRDYYFGTDDDTKRVREEYGKHLVAMFKLLGEDSTRSATSGAAVLKLETAF